MSLVTDMKTVLTAASYSNVFRRRLPPTPDSAIAVIQYAGRNPEFVHNNSGMAREKPGLQVLVRDPLAETAEDRMIAIFILLSQIKNADLGTSPTFTRYQRVEALGSPYTFEYDDKGRTVIACNFYIHKQI